MITVLTNPCEHNFSKSPVICELETDNAIYSGDFGDKAKFIFYVPPNPVDGNEFYISTGVLVGYIYFTNGINPLKWVVPLRSVGQTDAQYYNSVLSQIILDPGISANYDVNYVGGGGFLFEALTPGSTFSNISSSVNGAGFSFTNLLPGTTNFLTDVPRPNYKLGIDIYIQKQRQFPAPGYELVYSAEKTHFENKVKFDISKILDTFLDYYFPSPNQSIPDIARQTCKLFRIVIKEFYGSPVVTYNPTCAPDSILYSPGENELLPGDILKAGFSPLWNKVQPQNQLAAYVWSYPLYLTTRTHPIKIKLRQPEYLFFCFQNTCAQPVLKITTFFLDSTISVAYEAVLPSTVQQGFVCCFPINGAANHVHTQMLTGLPIKFTAEIVADADHNTAISPAATYIPVYEDLGEEKIFLYTNSMSGVDTFRSEGEYEQTIEFEKEVSSRIYYTTDASYLGDEVESQNTMQNYFKVFSGWKTEDEIHALEDLFLSKYKVEVIDYSMYVPIIITSKKYLKHKTNTFLKAIEIEYYHQNKSSVTDKLIAAL